MVRGVPAWAGWVRLTCCHDRQKPGISVEKTYQANCERIIGVAMAMIAVSQ
jgi:hypothetical protein